MNRHPIRPLSPRRILPSVLLSILVALAGACDNPEEGEAPPESGSTDALTRSLFSNPPEPLPERSVDFARLGYDFGSPDAVLRVAELSDFGCGYCRRFHEESFPALQEEYVNTGKVLWKYIPVVTGMFPHGDLAGLAGECAAEQDQFGGMLDRLFEGQSEWKTRGDALPLFLDYAQELQLNTEQFRSCIEEERPAERLAAGTRAFGLLGLRGTPSFLINGYPIQGALPTQLFRDILDAELAAIEEAGS